MKNNDVIDTMQNALNAANDSLRVAKLSLNSALKDLDPETLKDINRMIQISDIQPENAKEMIDSIMDKMQTKLKNTEDATSN